MSSCPGGDTGRVTGALRSIETVGSRIRSSRSLQSLESATADSFRSVRERTGEVILASDWLLRRILTSDWLLQLGSEVRRRYGSQLSVAMGRYEQLESGEELGWAR